MHQSGVSIWFFVGIALLVNGLLVLQAGIRELFSPPTQPVVLFHLHANIWWGAVLAAIGLFYCLRFRPSRSDKGLSN